MNQKDILRMAHEACILPSGDVYTEDIMDFARLIAEDCAKRCDALAAAYDASGEYPDACGADACAVEIREAYKP